MQIQHSQSGAGSSRVQAQAKKLLDKDPDSATQDQFLASTVADDGATRMERLVAQTTREAMRQAGSDEASTRVFEWSASTLANGVGSGPTGVVLAMLGDRCFDSIQADRGDSASQAVGSVFLNRIANDEGSTPQEKALAATVQSLVRLCGDDAATASKIEAKGLGMLSNGVEGTTGKFLGQLAATVCDTRNPESLNASLGQEVLYRVSDDPGSTPAEKAVADKALQASRGNHFPLDIQTPALLHLAWS